MRTITIEISDEKGLTVREGERYHDQLCWDEMIGQVIELTHPQIGKERYQMLTAAEWQEYNKRFEPRPTRAPDAPVLLLTFDQRYDDHICTGPLPF